ncbi:MAG: hypothetical protein E6G32_11465 [Actinobacteria bacterium]|nr:MAG: hypothetical protein E6G32_11465 [Actinomycetota bacterium]
MTPFEIDSTPVSAADPDAKAFRRTKSPTEPAVPTGSGCGTFACGHEPVIPLPKPTMRTAYIDAMNAYVGSANRSPDSRTPRRLPSVSTRMQASDSSTRYALSDGATDVIANTPAATETATVRM